MIYTLVSQLLVIAVLAFLLHRSERQLRDLLRFHHEERKELLNRIQAPEQAVAQSVEVDPEEKHYLTEADEDRLFEAQRAAEVA